MFYFYSLYSIKDYLTSQRADLGYGQTAPDPGTYSYDYTKLKRRPQRFVFGKAARSIGLMPKSKLPGPGQYSGAKTIFEISNSRKGYSFNKSKPNGRDRKKIPGPGTYDMKSRTFKSQFGFISKGTRVLGPKIIQTPGYHNVPSTIPNVASYNYPAENERKIRI